MKKSILMVGASLALAATMVVGGTFALYTDDERKVNVSSSKPVDVVLVEQQRDGNGGLEAFEQGKELLPIVGSAQSYGDAARDGYGLPKAKNYVDKIVSVDNKLSSNEAYVRVLVAAPTVLFGEDIADSGDDILHYNFANRLDLTNSGRYNDQVDGSNPAWTWYWNDAEVPLYYVEIDGVEYAVDTYTYKTPLAPGESAFPAIQGYYLDEGVNWDDETGEYSRNGKVFDFDLSTVMIPVAVEAIQSSVVVDTNGNDDIDVYDITAAFEAEGYGKSTKDTLANGKATGYNHWVTKVATVAELAKALNNDGNVVLTDDIELDENLVIADDSVVTIDLNGNKLSSTATKNAAIKADGDAKLTLKNGTVNAPSTDVLGIFGDAQITANNVVFNGKYCFGMNGSQTSENSSASFTDCKFHITSGYNAAYISAPGTYTFTNCVLEGGAGVLIRSGNVVLDGCTIIANGYMGKGQIQPDVYVNDAIDAVTDVVKDGVAYWTNSNQEGSTGDCVVIVDRIGSGYDLKSVVIKNCKFEVKNSVTVDGNSVATGYAVRYIDKAAPRGATITPVLENNTDINGNVIKNGTIGLVYSSYSPAN